jgi:hypothetical protein
VGMDLADLDEWDPNAIHTVFAAAIDRSNGVRGTATSIGDVLAATPWDGAAHDAAVAANGRIRADLIQHADACDAVGRAAATAEGIASGRGRARGQPHLQPDEGVRPAAAELTERLRGAADVA